MGKNKEETAVQSTLPRENRRSFAKDLKRDWQLYLLSSHTEFERCFGRQADKKRKLYNGMIKCDLFMYYK